MAKEASELRYNLFLDYDEGKGWFMRNPNPLWSDTIEIVRMEVKRLARACSKLKKAVILRSGGGWHVVFDADLSWREVESLMFYSRCHWGFRLFSLLVGDQTLRVSEKPDGTPAPYVVEVITFE